MVPVEHSPEKDPATTQEPFSYLFVSPVAQASRILTNSHSGTVLLTAASTSDRQLPHPIYDAENAEVCLFVKDHKGTTQRPLP